MNKIDGLGHVLASCVSAKIPTLVGTRLNKFTMGSLLNAVCTNCGFRKDVIYFGQGIKQRQPLIPAIDKVSGDLVTTDDHGDPNLRYYHDPSMYKGEITGDGIQSFDIRLNPEHNVCPACGKYSMRFEAFGEWD